MGFAQLCAQLACVALLAEITGSNARSCQLTPDVGAREPAVNPPKEGPLMRFYADTVPELCESDASDADAGAKHRRLEIRVHTQDQTCYLLYDTKVMIDQANAGGHESANCSVLMMTDSHNGDNGTFKFITTLPGPYKDARYPNAMRPSAIGLHVLKQDTCHCIDDLKTQVYFRDDPHRVKDPCKTCGSDNEQLFFDCLPFSTSAKPGELIQCTVNLTLNYSSECGSDTPPQPEVRCRPECVNGATCAKSGLCVCAAGYTGPLCDEKIAPEPVKCTATEPTPCAEMGPFWRPSQPRRSPMCVGDPNYNSSSVMKMQFTLKVQDDVDCALLAHTPVDLWHANSLGHYMDNDCRSADVTDENGMLTVETVYPMNYTGRPHHIHVIVHNTSMCHDRLVIQGYFKGDPLRSPQQEVCKSCHSDDPRLTLACEQKGFLMTCGFVATLKRYRERPGCQSGSTLRPALDQVNHHSHHHHHHQDPRNVV